MCLNGLLMKSLTLPLIVVLLMETSAFAQAERPTIPDVLARAGESLSGVSFVPSGPTPTVADILEDTDIIVRGVVGEPRSYLSEDQRDVYTDYPINGPTFLYQATLESSPKPGIVPSVVITVRGGSVRINGLTYTFVDYALRPLKPGSECLLLLKRVGDHYAIAGSYLGIFGVADGKLTPLTGKQGFAPEYRDVPVTQAANEIVMRRRALR